MLHNYTEIKKLILDYQKAVFDIAHWFYNKYKTKDLIKASRDGTFPRSGFISKRCHYSFHGAGLGTCIGTIWVDCDFGPDNAINGFDASRLNRFASNQREKYQSLDTESKIQKELDQLLLVELISKPGLGPGISNYYWDSTFYSLNIENLKKASKAKKRKLIEIDLYNYMRRFLSHSIPISHFQSGISILQEPKLITKEEILDLLQSKTNYEGYQMALGKNQEERLKIKEKIKLLKNLKLE